MWPFNLFKKHPFTHNPEDFQLKIVESWFSNEYVQFEYSANGGRTWKTIYHAHPPFLGSINYDWDWKPLSYSLGNGDFRFEKEKFSSYQKILDYEKEQEKIYYEGQESIKRQRKQIEERRLEALKRANN